MVFNLSCQLVKTKRKREEVDLLVTDTKPRKILKRRHRTPAKTIPIFDVGVEEEEDVVFTEAPSGKVRIAVTEVDKPRKKRTKRKPGLKARLLKKLRARRKVLTAELRQIDRDIASLVPKKQ